VRPLGRERTAAVAAPDPLTPPTHGYNVFRPWSLTPAPCPQTCTTPNIPLKQWYADLAAHKIETIAGNGQLGTTPHRNRDLGALLARYRGCRRSAERQPKGNLLHGSRPQ